ncbi:MAG: methylmalonyl Co-A mutase-associated GTPase MeaB [Firmicutes bacterium]|nr:methylmalonyl Co-A mutase-associated GTPase MeaB [Bacillota bacterium]
MISARELVPGIVAGHKRAIARGLTWIERDHDRGRALVHLLFPRAGGAHIVGVTGAPGVGKSTLVNRLTLTLRSQGRRVGILAVDPSSPFSGGAILGDRIRMQESVMDDGVFMRSLATRGHLGGLSRATFGAVTLLAAAGFDVILIETVGAGQSEVEVMQLAHTTLVVLAPGLGDEIQAIKAGILEIGDAFVVNKADREGADQTARAIRGMLSLSRRDVAWVPPVVKTVAEQGEGIEELVDAVNRHRQYLDESGQWAERRGALALHLIELAMGDWTHRAIAQAQRNVDWSAVMEDVLSGGADVEELARQLLLQALKGRNHEP